MASTPVRFIGSSDDILLHKTPTKLIDKVQRPRSASPVKRYSLPASFVDKRLPNLPITSSNDITSLKSNSSSFDMSNERWRELTRSPAARKLHIADVGGSPKYTIPIPFTLQLPPKLSARNIERECLNPTSPESKRSSKTPFKIKQTQLVYTGNGYEKLDYPDPEFETLKYPESPTPKSRNKTLQPLPRRPAPPPVAFNKSPKSPKQIQRIIDADELSIIEERHSEFSTRQSSLREKNIKSLSIKPIQIDFKPVQEATPEAETEALFELFPIEPSYGVASTIDQTIYLDATAKQYSPANSNIDNTHNQKTRKIEFNQIGNEPYLKTRKLEFKSIGNSDDNKSSEESPAKPTTKILDFKYIGESEPEKSSLSPEYSGEFYSSNFDTLNDDSGFTQPLSLNHNKDSTTTKENKISPLLANFKFLNGTLKKLTSPKKNSNSDSNRDIKHSTINTAYNKDYSLQIPDRIFSDESHCQSVSITENNSTKDDVSLVVAETTLSNSHLDTCETNIEINGGLHLQPPQRAASSLSVATDTSEGTSCSWNSLQKSIDITLGTQNDTATITPSTDQESAIDKTLNDLSENGSENGSDWEDDFSGSIIESNDQMLPLTINKKSLDHDVDVTKEERYFEDSVIAAYYLNDNDSSYFSEHVEQIPEEEEQNYDNIEHACQAEEEETEHTNEQNDLHDKIAQVNYNCDVAETPDLDMQEEVIIRQDAVSHLDTSSVPTTIIDKFEEENSGAGKSFYFPNNSSNITNSHEIKSRSFGSTKSKISRISYFSNNGQIEIPDLTEDSVAGSYTTKASYISHNGTTFDDIGSVSSISTAVELEPIGIPSKGAQNVLRQHMHGLNDSSGESNDEFETANIAIGEIRSRSSPNLQLERSKPSPIPSPIRSPARHARHKSMHSIDFDVTTLLKDKKLPALPAESKKQYENKDLENIVVAPPPIQVNYAIDFVEANKDLETNACNRAKLVNKADEVMDSLSRQMQKASMKRHSIRNTGQANKANLSETSKSSYQSSGSFRPDPPTSVSDQDDADSVVIDLTKEKYDITTIHRNNSTHSYKSVIEKTKDGKEVEVVLLEDDEDLLSIYSKYRKMQLLRSGSMQSSVGSENSAYSYNSIASSRQLILKPNTGAMSIDRNTSNLGGKVSDRRHRNSISSSSSGISSSYDYRRIQPPAMKDIYSPKKSPQKDHRKRHTVDFDANYFDYSSKEKYDFHSFKKQINGIPTTTL